MRSLYPSSLSLIPLHHGFSISETICSARRWMARWWLVAIDWPTSGTTLLAALMSTAAAGNGHGRDLADRRAAAIDPTDLHRQVHFHLAGIALEGLEEQVLRLAGDRAREDRVGRRRRNDLVMGPPFDFLDDRLGQLLAQFAAITAGIEDGHVNRLDAFGEERSGAELVVAQAQAAGQRRQPAARATCRTTSQGARRRSRLVAEAMRAQCIRSTLFSLAEEARQPGKVIGRFVGLVADFLHALAGPLGKRRARRICPGAPCSTRGRRGTRSCCRNTGPSSTRVRRAARKSPPGPGGRGVPLRRVGRGIA